MPSSSPSPKPSKPSAGPEILLAAARPFIRNDLASVDAALPGLVDVLHSRGASECWHKHGNFFSHLFAVYRVLKLWQAPNDVALCGLFHSAYSNSYVNLAIFDPSTSRSHVQSLIGASAERLVHLFCVVPRQALVHDNLLFKYETEEELSDHLRQSEISIRNLREKGESDPNEPWRQKLNSLVPPEGVIVKHIKTKEDVNISRRLLAVFLIVTLADFADQLTAWFDDLLQNDSGRLDIPSTNPNPLWPGNAKPALWTNSVSRIASVYNMIVREEEIYLHERKTANGHVEVVDDRDEDIELIIPPIFDNCTRVLDAQDQIDARDLYWQAFYSGAGMDKVEEMLRESIAKNPFVGEPYLVLSQVCLGKGKFEEAEAAAEKGLLLVLQWGTSWDKNVSWEGWVAWGRVLLMKAEERHWPNTAWGVLNLGLVK